MSMTLNTESDPAPTATQSGRWAALIALYIVLCAMQMSNFGFTPLVMPIQKAFGMSFTLVGLFVGIAGVIGIIMSIPAGILMKHFGERVMITSGLALIIVGLIIVASASSGVIAFIGRIIWQIAFTSLAGTVVQASIVLNAPKQWQAMFMGIGSSAAALAASVGARLTGVVAPGYGWRGGFWLFAIVTVIGLLVFLPVYRKVMGRAVEPPTDHHTAPKPRSAFRTPVVWFLALVFFFCSVPGVSLIFMGAPILGAQYKLTVEQVSSIISLGWLLAIVVSYGVGWLADRTDRRLILGSIMTIFIALGLLMLVDNVDVARAVIVIGLSLCMSVPALVFAISGNAMQGREVGPIMGVVAMGGACATYFGPQIMGLVKDVTGGFTIAWYVDAVIGLLGLIGVLCLPLAVRKSAEVG